MPKTQKLREAKQIGNAIRKARIAKGEADAIFMKKEAEAKGMYEILTKQALGLEQIVKAAGDNAKDAVLLLVADKLPEKYNSKLVILNNGQGVHRLDFYIQAIAMYNLPEEENSKHPKGRGNGYILNIDDKRIYISGDTEDILEMRMLRNIDVVFLCMNLPFTMDINQASSAVLEFKPKVVYPYHYRGTEGLSDVNEFKKLVRSC